MTNDLLTTKKNSPAEKAKKLMELQTLYKEIKPQIEELKAELLQIMIDQDVLMLKTGSYTLSRAKRITPFVAEFHLLKKTLDDKNIPYETEEVFTAQTNVMFRQAIEEGRDLPGLEKKITEYVAVRVKNLEGKEEKHE